MTATGAHAQSPLLPFVCILLFAVMPALALRCYRCGEYTDGVGSITPCLNYTAQRHLKECPAESTHCVKYVSEASIVRECIVGCVEKAESWGTKVYCCSEDECNVASVPTFAASAAVAAMLVYYGGHLLI